MRPHLTAFALGAAAFGALALLGAIAVGAFADASGRATFELALGGLTFLSFERDAGGTSTTLGPGLAAVAAAGGVLNAGGAALLSRGGRRRE